MCGCDAQGITRFIGGLDLKDEVQVDNVYKKDNKGNTWRRIGVTADSGAAESVIPRGLVQGPVVPNPELDGVSFRAANGSPINVYGIQGLRGRDSHGTGVSMKLTSADVRKPLASVMKIVQKGNRVVFDPKGSYIEHKHGHKTPLREEKGVYVFDVWVPEPKADFRRQE